MTRRGGLLRGWLEMEIACLGEVVFWWLVIPAALAFLWLVFLAGDLVVVSGWLYGLVIAMLVGASFVVLCTTLLGHRRAKRRAAVVRTQVNETTPLVAGASPRSVERVDNPAHLGRSVIVTSDFTVTKEYFEDIIEPDELGHGGYEYRYWDYTFDFGSRTYRARVYTDEPERASVFRTDSSDFPLDDPPEREQLRAIRSHLEAEPLPRVDGRHMQILVFGKSDAYVWARLDG